MTMTAAMEVEATTATMTTEIAIGVDGTTVHLLQHILSHALLLTYSLAFLCSFFGSFTLLVTSNWGAGGWGGS